MIGKDDSNEEVSFKVADRRKFNLDGSLKEGVTLEPAIVEEKPQSPATTPGKDSERHKADDPDSEPTGSPESGLPEDDELPGIDDPASFVNFLSTLATN